jgi:putative transposase
VACGEHRPAFPARFASVEAARAHCQDFFRWYNNDHRHGGLGLHTAADVHHGHAERAQAQRGRVLDAAYQAHPERFVSKPPAPPDLPGTSWINPPQEKEPATRGIEGFLEFLQVKAISPRTLTRPPLRSISRLGGE